MDIFEKNTDEEYRFILPDGTSEAEAKAHSISSDDLLKHIIQGKIIKIKNAYISGALIFQGKHTASEILIHGTTFDSELDWTNSTFEKPVSLDGCLFKSTFRAQSATFNRESTLSRSIFEGIFDCRSTMFLGNALFEKTTFNQEVILDSCEFGRNLYLNNAKIHGKFSITNAIVSKSIQAPGCVFYEEAVWAQARIGKDIHCKKAVFKKALLFHNAYVGQSITFTDCNFSDFNFNNSEVHGNLSLSSSQFHGKVSIVGASIYGNIGLSKGVVDESLTINSTFVKGHVKGVELTIKGESNLVACNIEGGLDLSRAHCKGLANFRLSHIKLSIRLNHAKFGKGLDLSYCKTGELILSRENIESSKTINIKGAEYSSVKYNMDIQALIDAQSPFSLQPFTYMEAYSRDAGESAKADKIYYRARRRNSQNSALKNITISELPLWIKDRVHWFFSGYGVKNYRSMLVVFLSFILVFFVFSQPNALSLYPLNSSDFPIGLMSSERSLYKADCSDIFFTTMRHLLPIPDIPRACGWRPTDNSFYGVHFTTFATFLEIIGWIFIPAFIAGFAGFLKR